MATEKRNGNNPNNTMAEYKPGMAFPGAIGIGGGLSVGRNQGAPVSRRCHPAFAFTGNIHKVTADVSGKMIQDKEEEDKARAKAMMARQ